MEKCYELYRTRQEHRFYLALCMFERMTSFLVKRF